MCAEVDPVEGIEHLGSELDVKSLIYPKGLCHREVNVLDAGPPHHAATEVADLPLCRESEGQRVNDLKRIVTVGIDVRACHEVRTLATGTTEPCSIAPRKDVQRSPRVERGDSVELPVTENGLARPSRGG